VKRKGSISKAVAYSAATTRPLHRFSRRGDVKSAEDPASPESAIFINALALNRSTATYRRYVKIGRVDELGRRENRGRKSGAWW